MCSRCSACRDSRAYKLQTEMDSKELDGEKIIVKLDEKLTHTFKYHVGYLQASTVFCLSWLPGHWARIFMILPQKLPPVK